ncbi:hypothetical protein OSB04_005072 [Centaurea solstitialis]|uniref:Endonuclease/exonuclease/phosphatase domain-containing protein n=1 Tax=Centaurea solstitialis TaxID=347529 RepID=A0AA38WG27_9ASTR|nr:hypothetical protein OSB04_005072 [Centaurea solstitialis]
MRQENCFVLGLQESKCESVSSLWVSKLWGQKDFDFVCVNSIGQSGGILLSWDTVYFNKDSVIKGTHFCGAIGAWQNVDIKVGLINVYAPQSHSLKAGLWNDLTALLKDHTEVIWVIMGDFNAVRFPEERMGSVFDEKEASDFNSFISESGLLDVQFCGRRFTRSSKDGRKLSKLDRFLVSSNFFPIWNNPLVQVLPQTIADHCPLVLQVEDYNYGPKPFRFFDSWLNIVEFCDN